GTNDEDIETTTPAARGCVLSADVTEPSSWRAARPLGAWLRAQGLVGISGVDTRRLTRYIRDTGAPSGVVCHAPDDRRGLAGAGGHGPRQGRQLTADLQLGRIALGLGRRLWPTGGPAPSRRRGR